MPPSPCTDACFTGPFVSLGEAERDAWFERLENFTIDLLRDGEKIDTGRSQNVLGGPLSALKAFVEGLPGTALATTVGPGEVVTTGTLTRAFRSLPENAGRPALADCRSRT